MKSFVIDQPAHFLVKRSYQLLVEIQSVTGENTTHAAVGLRLAGTGDVAAITVVPAGLPLWNAGCMTAYASAAWMATGLASLGVLKSRTVTLVSGTVV